MRTIRRKTKEEPRETVEQPLRHDEDPRYRGTDPHDTFQGERRAHSLRRQRSADGGGSKRGSPASRDSRRQ